MAVVCGKPEQRAGKLYRLFIKGWKNKYFQNCARKNTRGKTGRIIYEIIKQGQKNEMDLFLISILLKTGRHHQIRVQFAGHGTPLFGDRKYGGEGRELALFACQLSFFHPKSGQKMVFHEEPEGEGFDIFNIG